MKVFYLLVLTCFSLQAFSQESSNKFSLELMQYQNIDKTLIPLKNTGPGIRASYIFEKLNGDDLKTFSVSLAAANPKTDIERTRKSISASVYASFDQQKKISNSNFFIGYSASISYKDAFYKTVDETHLYWSNFLGGGLSSSYFQALNSSSKLSIRFKLPLIGLVSRSPEDRLSKFEDPSFSNILKLNQRDVRFTTVADYFQPTTEIEYRHNFSKRHAFAIFYRNEYLSTTTKGSLQYKELQNGLGVRLIAIKN